MKFDKELVDSVKGCYNLNIGKCARIPGIPSIIKEVFLKLQDTSYINVGEFFATMSNADVSLLLDLSDKIHIDNQYKYSDEAKEEALFFLTLFGLGLATGEGLDLTDDNNESFIRIGLLLITLESLYRKNLVVVYHEHWSFDIDNTRPLAERSPF